jgi:hypothetical protein
MILFEYKGVKITGQSRDELELLTAELKKQIDQIHYHQSSKDILWEYISDDDNVEIQKRLEKI